MTGLHKLAGEGSGDRPARPSVGAFTALVAAAIAMISCSGSPSSPSGTSRSGNPNLRLMLTDAPIDDVDEVNVYFTGATANLWGAGSKGSPSSSTRIPWTC